MTVAEPEPYRDPLWEHVSAWLELWDNRPDQVFVVVEVRASTRPGAHTAFVRGAVNRWQPRELVERDIRVMFGKCIKELDKTLHA